jgi:hypothetical protein
MENAVGKVVTSQYSVAGIVENIILKGLFARK